MAVGVFTVTEASLEVPEVVAVWSAAHVMVGAGVSVTVMVKLQLPPPVPEETFTVVVPTGKNVPEAGLLVTVPQSPDDSISPAKFTIAPGLPP